MKKNIILYALLAAFVFGFSNQASAKQITVKKGDSMWLIAKRYNVPFLQVLELNRHNHINVDLIHPNDIIEIPDGSHGSQTSTNSTEDEYESGNVKPQAHGVSTMAEAVLILVNNERRNQGLSELSLDEKLTNIATMKSKDMADKGYFSHTSPTYGSPFEMLQKYGVSYRSAGENIAAGQRTAQEVMSAWMNSSGHRANILNPKYTEIGVGYYVGGYYGTYWTQTFIGK